MKIIFDATVMQLPATGIAKSTLGLYSECLRQNKTLQVSGVHRRALQCALPSNIESSECGKYFSESAWRKVFLPAYIALRGPMAMHFPWNGNVPRGLSNTKVITTLNDVLPLVIPGFFKSTQEEETYRSRVQTDIDRTDVLVTISEYSKNEILKNFKLKVEPFVIPLGPTTFSHEYELSQETSDNNYFVYVGGYDARKGIEPLIKTFISINRNIQHSCKLVLSGSKNYYSAEFKRLVEEGVQTGIVEERGYVSDQELAHLLVNAIALVYPSKYEGFGLPPLEAMALGCPVITTKCTSIPEICGDAAYYVNPDDEKDFADAIIALINDKELRISLRQKGFVQARKFTWEAAANKFLGSVLSAHYKH